jgi:hypothetical protein
MIDSYGFGQIVINGKTYTSDVIIYPNKVDSSWWRKEGHELGIEDLKDVLEQNPDMIIVGTGYSGIMKVLPETKKLIESKKIKLVIEDTRRAWQSYNEFSKKQKVIAMLHLTC